jgi:hypothetical protein
VKVFSDAGREGSRGANADKPADFHPERRNNTAGGREQSLPGGSQGKSATSETIFNGVIEVFINRDRCSVSPRLPALKGTIPPLEMAPRTESLKEKEP